MVLFFSPGKGGTKCGRDKAEADLVPGQADGADSEKGRARATIPDSVCEKIFRETKQEGRECR